MAEKSVSRLVATAFCVNAGLLVGLAAVYYFTHSQLVLAQGSDSLLDLVAGGVLWVTARVSMQPQDEDHPFGHHRAEPIGALITAVFAGVLAFEVGQSAIWSLLAESRPSLNSTVWLMLGGKASAKLIFFGVLLRSSQNSRSPALHATRIDTRNDILAALSSLIGAGLYSAGWQQADSLLAIPVAIYIGGSGFQLARENIRYLMGEAPDEKTLEELRSLATRPAGVVQVRRVRAHHVGAVLHVEVTVLIDEHATATESHDIGVAVQHEVEAHTLVAQAFIHVDTHTGRPHEPQGGRPHEPQGGESHEPQPDP